MEEVTEGVKNLAVTEPHKKNGIQVSNTKKPLFFYVNLAKVNPLFSPLLRPLIRTGFRSKTLGKRLLILVYPLIPALCFILERLCLD